MEQEKTENEKKKAYLWRYRKAVLHERELTEELHELQLEMIPGSQRQDGMPHGSGGDRDLSGYVAELIELEEEIREQREKSRRIQSEIGKCIERVEDEEQRTVLRYRYIRGFKWEQIAATMGCSWKGVHRMHSAALKNFEKNES